MRFLLLAVLLVCGCGPRDEPSSGKREGEKFLRCAAPHDDGLKERFSLRPLTVQRTGLDLEIRGLKRGLVIIGLLAGIHEPLPETLANLDFFLSRFREAGVQLIAVAGGVGLSEKQVGAVLKRLAQAPVPVLVVPGAQESFDVVRQTISSLRKKHPQLIDMTRVRRVRIGHVALVSLPGYYKPFYLEARERGCSYEEQDLVETAELFDSERTTVLLAASPPRGKGPKAVDRGRGGVNIGDPFLARLLARKKLNFGLFGHVYESGGQATDAKGKMPLAQGIWHDSLFLQAGAADAVPVSLIGGGRAVGMGQIVELSGKRGRFRTLVADQRQAPTPKSPTPAP